MGKSSELDTVRNKERIVIQHLGMSEIDLFTVEGTKQHRTTIGKKRPTALAGVAWLIRGCWSSAPKSCSFDSWSGYPVREAANQCFSLSLSLSLSPPPLFPQPSSLSKTNEKMPLGEDYIKGVHLLSSFTLN